MTGPPCAIFCLALESTGTLTSTERLPPDATGAPVAVLLKRFITYRGGDCQEKIHEIHRFDTSFILVPVR